jgi:hypothetical protein
MSGHHTHFFEKMDWAKGRKEKKDANGTFELSARTTFCGCKVMIGLLGVMVLHRV